MEKTVMDVRTGVAETVPLSAEEIADIEARRAAEAEASKPRRVTMRQARLALLQQNLLASVESAVAQAGTAAQIEWEYATELRRDHPLTVSLSAALGLTEQQLDDLFTLAAGL
jgi:hypothetical protein